ncbi:MAG: phosphoribosylamine--glycine ligase [Phaeodactylibacter xiamenensis]|uniref:Phosphoribosylamine--glycine ligase n=1 Tax=Phaeodactylibacter xiamenensis TaxID=1524460 RepID=A0A098RYQ2_9BACT|nr:phosphoribosylamine--glycine ligase [Phaeodactylibacter xiamenensis]KGE84981.1 phosphoribosylamine--glycine ligase [Phaeodactylibacter xiamenensis]MCR9051599.1 phosphoribosylamine--glycine ligase [bacterium]
MNILLLGSGGREHAFAWKMSQSPLCKALFIAPGNAGTAQHGTNVALSPNDFEAVGAYVLEKEISMVVVGPEEPLVRGIYDYFKADDTLKHVRVIGPSALGAKLEGSKAFAKAFMQQRDIPTAAYAEFTPETLEEGLSYIDRQDLPIVLKADGLAAGKGVLILNDRAEAKAELKAMLSGKFGEASERVVIEAFLDGIEFSVFVLTDGKSYKILPIAKDYKRIGEGDTGLNTGGMGAISPVPFVDDTLLKKVENWIVSPTLTGLKELEAPYEGFIFLGLIKVGEDPYVIEYNCRMGDPETEVVFPRLKSDLVELLAAIGDGTLESKKLEVEEQSAATVFLVSGGYPEAYEKGKIITGLEQVEGSLILHAGTKTEDGAVKTNGGRVLALTSLAGNYKEAVKQSLENAARVQFEGKYYRTDIGFDL